MTPYLPTSLIAQHPNWHYADFECRAFQISAELQQRQLRSVTVWLEDGATLACLLLGAWHANVRVLFPPNFTGQMIILNFGSLIVILNSKNANKSLNLVLHKIGKKLLKIDRSLTLVTKLKSG